MAIYVAFGAPIDDHCEVFSVSQTALPRPPSAGGARAPDPSWLKDLHIAKKQDQLSPRIFSASVNGTPFPWIWVEMYTGDHNTPYLTYKMTNAIIVSYQVMHDSGGTSGGTETIVLNYEKLDVDHS